MIASLPIANAEAFLAPVLRRDARFAVQRSLIDCLYYSLTKKNFEDGQVASGLDKLQIILENALNHIQRLHRASCELQSHQPEIDAIANQKLRKIVDALLDLVSLEGIYPSLSPGVGAPVENRVRSALNGGLVTRPVKEDTGGKPEDAMLLKLIADDLRPILLSNQGLKSIIQERVFVDILSALSELAYCPSYDSQIRLHYQPILTKILDSNSASNMFPVLTTLIHPSSPEWLRSPLSYFLSMLPLRTDGVRQTINFVAASSAETPNLPENPSEKPAGPNISLDALGRVSKLLSSVPSTMTTESYFSALSPQLLELIDDSAPDNRRIASFIIGHGILSRRKLGSPGTVGWRLFAQPILETLSPIGSNPSVPETALKRALDRLSALILLHPNPGLTKRLISVVFLPLWGLVCYATEIGRSSWSDQAQQLLSTYMKLSMDSSKLLMLSEHILWDGDQSWKLGPGAEGGIEIRERLQDDEGKVDTTALLQQIDSRAMKYSDMIRSTIATDDQVSEIFTHVSRLWLMGDRINNDHETLETENDNLRNPVQSLVYVKLTQKLLGDFKDRIASNAGSVIQLVDQILSIFVHEHRRHHDRKTKPSKLSRTELESIMISNGQDYEDEHAIETASTALSLLSAMLSASSFSFGAEDAGIFGRLQQSLEYISKSKFSSGESLSTTASNILMLLQLQQETSFASIERNPRKAPATFQEDRNVQKTALTHLIDDMPPVRGQGLSTLTELIARSSPVLDVPSTAFLLLSLLQDSDEYIFLSAIRTLGLLASNHSRMVIKMLVNAYVDPNEDSSLDARIKIGEALMKTIEHLDQAFVGEGAKTVGEGMISVASRRGEKPKGMERRENAKRKEEASMQEATSAWGTDIVEENVEDEEGKLNEQIRKVVEGWEGSGLEEDVRIRTSALSIIGTAIETNVAALGAVITSTAVDCVLAILKLEKSEEKAILRRAAVTVILSLIKALDVAEEQGRQLGFGFAGENLADIIIVLRYIEATDSDELVVGHTRAVIESLEAWQQKSILGISRSREYREPKLELGNGKLAGLAIDPESVKRPKPRIEEVS